jgi:hypothetical protein
MGGGWKGQVQGAEGGGMRLQVLRQAASGCGCGAGWLGHWATGLGGKPKQEPEPFRPVYRLKASAARSLQSRLAHAAGSGGDEPADSHHPHEHENELEHAGSLRQVRTDPWGPGVN